MTAARLSSSLNQTLIVENRSGATGATGSGAAARAKPDGYTFLFGFAGSMVLMPLLQTKLPYNPQRDFDAVARIATYDFVLVARSDFPARDLEELVALAKRSNQPVSYATHGVGSPSHLAMTSFSQQADVLLEHIPYRGETPMLADLQGGHISLGWLTLNVAEPLIKSGKLKPIVIASPRRSQKISDTKTFNESGFEKATFEAWCGLMAPRGTPSSTIERLSNVVAKTLSQSGLHDDLLLAGFNPSYLGPRDFEELIDTDIDRYKILIKEAGLQAQ